ncbi:MAG TPA: hypothetical protein VKC53_04055 [Patescibacteria group bacterium]|nr:hypothetical protein [Patescibacteria group bacterium]
MLRKNILEKELELRPDSFWLPDQKDLHITIVSYSHYSQVGLNVVSLPKTEQPEVGKIIKSFDPVSITLDGVVITSNGSLLIKGYVDNDELTKIREALKKNVKGITQIPQNLVHMKLAQILTSVPYELVEKVNRLYSQHPFGKIRFQYATGPDREHYYFK